MTKSKKIRNGPDLEKHIRKRHRYATYLEASRLFSIPYYSLVRIAKEANACWKIRKTVIVDMDKHPIIIGLTFVVTLIACLVIGIKVLKGE